MFKVDYLVKIIFFIILIIDNKIKYIILHAYGKLINLCLTNWAIIQCLSVKGQDE